MTGKDTSSPTAVRKPFDDEKKSDSKSSSSTTTSRLRHWSRQIKSTNLVMRFGFCCWWQCLLWQWLAGRTRQANGRQRYRCDDVPSVIRGRRSDETRAISSETCWSKRTCTPAPRSPRAGELGSGKVHVDRRHVPSAQRCEVDRAGIQCRVRTAGMCCWRANQERRSLCGFAAEIWHQLDPDGQVRRDVVDRGVP